MRLRLVLIPSVLLIAACSSTGPKPAESPAPAAPVKGSEATPAKAQESPKKAASAGAVKCSVAGDERLLEVRAQGKGCELAYTKGGNEGIVASSANGSEHCQSVQQKIKERLSGAGFTCQ